MQMPSVICRRRPKYLYSPLNRQAYQVLYTTSNIVVWDGSM